MALTAKKITEDESAPEALANLDKGWAELTDDSGIRFLADMLHEEKGWPMEACEEIARTRAREMQYSRKAEKATFVAETDDMTGFFNKRKFELQLNKEIARALRHGQTMSLLMMDMDKFKLINDNFGHLVGDDAIKILGKLIEKAIRDEDYAARFGGEEFAVILVNTTEGKMVADRLRERVERDFKTLLLNRIKEKHPEVSRKIEKESKKQLNYFTDVVKGTISIGVATIIGEEYKKISTHELVEQADSALLEAKGSGRNMVGVNESGKIHIYNKTEQLDRLKTNLSANRYLLELEEEKLEIKTEILEGEISERAVKLTSDEIEDIKIRIKGLHTQINYSREKIAEIEAQLEDEVNQMYHL